MGIVGGSMWLKGLLTYLLRAPDPPSIQMKIPRASVT